MAVREYAEYGVPEAYGPGRAQRIVQYGGAVASVALVLAMGLWGYKLAVRDVAGVPVIRALEGPMRVAPVEPGGSVADHQGLSVNEVAALGSAAAPSERLVLAPKPVELSLEDLPGLVETVSSDGANVSTRSDHVAALLPVASGSTDPALAAALSEALGADLDAAFAPEETASLDDAGLPAPEGAITRSLRPMPRPDRSGAVATASAAASTIKPVEVDPATLAVGTRLVQFGAYDSDGEAREEWQRLAGRFGDLMAGKAMVIQAAESGGRTFYRLRALGFQDDDDTRRFCSALVAESATCIPVAHR